jgi:hypothetical protein
MKLPINKYVGLFSVDQKWPLSLKRRILNHYILKLPSGWKKGILTLT